MRNNCFIKLALYAILLQPSTQSSYYNIRSTAISECLNGLYDAGRHHQSELPAGQYPSEFRSNSIESTLGGLLYPFNGTAGQPNTQYMTYEAIHLEVDGDAYLNPASGAVDVNVGPNTIRNAVYGIVANNPTYAGRYFTLGGVMTGIRRVGLWLDQDGPRLGNVPFDISLEGTRTATAQTRAADKAYGIYATERINYNSIGAGSGLRIYGNHGADTLNYKNQIGQYYEKCYGDIDTNVADNLTFGISIGDGTHASLVNNTFVDCWRGVYVRPNGNSSPDYYIGCNSFTNSAAATGFRAITVAENARLNGTNEVSFQTTSGVNPYATNTSPGPAGNKFTGYSPTNASFVYNDNSSTLITYQRFTNSNDEPGTMVVEGIGGGTVPPGNPSISNLNNCAARGYGATGAMNRSAQAGGGPVAGPTAARIQALMDTVRRQAAPARRLLAYRAEIRQYHFDQGQQAALHTYALTLVTANPAAFFAYGLDLLYHYRRTRQGAALLPLRLALGRHPLAADPERAGELAYFDVVGRLGDARLGPGQTPVPADSAALRRLAESGYSVADGATERLRYYYPLVRLTPAPLRLQPAPEAKALRAVAFGLYPNPATDRLTLRYAGAPGQTAELRLVDLVSGQTRHRVALPAGQSAEQAVPVALPHLPAGTYGCQVVVGGAVQATQRLVIQ
jgi:hypothetical protein